MHPSYILCVCVGAWEIHLYDSDFICLLPLFQLFEAETKCVHQKYVAPGGGASATTSLSVKKKTVSFLLIIFCHRLGCILIERVRSIYSRNDTNLTGRTDAPFDTYFPSAVSYLQNKVK